MVTNRPDSAKTLAITDPVKPQPTIAILCIEQKELKRCCDLYLVPKKSIEA